MMSRVVRGEGRRQGSNVGRETRQETYVGRETRQESYVESLLMNRK